MRNIYFTLNISKLLYFYLTKVFHDISKFCFDDEEELK